jgi:hypothetical protein
MIVTISTQEGASESIPVEPETPIKILLELSAPLVGMNPENSVMLFNTKLLDQNLTIAGAGVQDGDLLLIVPKQQQAQQYQQQPRQNNTGTTGLDFGSLLSNGGGGGGGGLNLIPNLQRANSAAVKS